MCCEQKCSLLYIIYLNRKENVTGDLKTTDFVHFFFAVSREI